MKNKQKNNKYNFDDLLREEFCGYLTEESFYPPSDDRVWESYIEDINGGDNFADYCGYIFGLYEEEEIWYR